MEIFIEHMVKRILSPSMNLLKVLIIIFSAILAIIVFVACSGIRAISFLGIFLAAGIIYLSIWLVKSFNVEYEYILTNDQLDVDKIIAQSRRKRITTVSMVNIEMLAPKNEAYRREYENEGIKTKIDASSGDASSTYFVKYSSNKTGMTVLFFNPDDRILDGARQYSPRKVFRA